MIIWAIFWTSAIVIIVTIHYWETRKNDKLKNDIFKNDDYVTPQSLESTGELDHIDTSI